MFELVFASESVCGSDKAAVEDVEAVRSFAAGSHNGYEVEFGEVCYMPPDEFARGKPPVRGNHGDYSLGSARQFFFNEFCRVSRFGKCAGSLCWYEDTFGGDAARGEFASDERTECFRVRLVANRAP